MKSKLWISGFFIIILLALGVIAKKTITIDPYFHYHKPNTNVYYYRLNNQRSQNNGITKNFEYGGVITGSSMTENFKTSEAEEIFGTKFIKVSYSGGSFSEINDNLKVATRNNNDLNIVIRGLDMAKFFDEKDTMRSDLGNYPKYLYDNNPVNDVEYLFNRDVVFSRIYPMVTENNKPNFKGGITTFDEYSNWMHNYKFGYNTIFPKGITIKEPAKSAELTEKEAVTIRENIKQNVVALAEEYPDIKFYYFFPPYSAAWWQSLLYSGNLKKQIQGEKIVIEEILKCKSIKLFSFNCLFDITTDLNNYKDITHYGEWVNSLMLKYMKEDKCLLGPENYNKYLEEEYQFYSTYNYSLLAEQEDYDNDYYAGALLNSKITGVAPYQINLENDTYELMHAVMKTNQYKEENGIVCYGSLQRQPRSEPSLAEYVRDIEYIGMKLSIDNLSKYQYLVFYGKKITNHGQPTVYIFDDKGKVVASKSENYHNLDNKWHQYIIDISNITEQSTIVFNGGYIDNTGNTESKYVFSSITFY